MKMILIGLAVLPFLAGSASATGRLSDQQLDTVAAGQFPAIDCPGCTLASSSSASTNGVTTTINTSTIFLPPTAPGGGSNNGGNGGSNVPSAPSAPSVLTTLQMPANVAGILNAASVTAITQ
jgi:hypothetical protein